jgi:thioester reductase-like protein
LIRDTGAGTVINCIGNTNVLVPYRELRLPNVDLVRDIAETCATRGIRLVQLSTYVVNADVTVARVTDPRNAPYPYAASKSVAELVMASSSPALDFTIVRLPRVLGEDYQLRDSADILVSVVDACGALGAYPSLALTEEVTTGRAAATAILGLLPEFGGSTGLGRNITVLRGETVDYAQLLSGFAADELDVVEWKQRLDESDWAKRNPRRWSVVDGWVSLGMRLGARSYAEYLSDYPTLALGVDGVAELCAPPASVRELFHVSATAPIV